MTLRITKKEYCLLDQVSTLCYHLPSLKSNNSSNLSLGIQHHKPLTRKWKGKATEQMSSAEEGPKISMLHNKKHSRVNPVNCDSGRVPIFLSSLQHFTQLCEFWRICKHQLPQSQMHKDNPKCKPLVKVRT